MALQLKENPNQPNNGNNVNEATDNNTFRSPKPMDFEMDEPFVSNGNMQNNTYTPSYAKADMMGTIIKWVIFVVAIIVAYFVIKGVVHNSNPLNHDITNLLHSSEQEISTQLGVTLEDNPTISNNLIEFSGGNKTVRANKDVGVVYIDGKQVGVHINSRKYSMYGTYVGLGEQDAAESLANNFQYDDIMRIIDNGGKRGTATYYYYNAGRNDCVAVVLSETTNRVIAMTYYSNYKILLKNADTF